MWDFGRSVYGSFVNGLGAATASLYELQQRRVALERMLSDKNELMKRLSAAGDEAGAKTIRKEYIELTKARDILYGQIKASNKGVLPALPSAAAPKPAPKAAPVAPIVPGQCYEGRVPNDRYWRGVQTGSDEPFTAGGHTIIRSDGCGTGWMVLDPKALERARQAQVAPIVRRAAPATPTVPVVTADMRSFFSYWEYLYRETYADGLKDEGIPHGEAWDKVESWVNSKTLTEFISENAVKWHDWFGRDEALLRKHIEQWFINEGHPEKIWRPAPPRVVMPIDENIGWGIYHMLATAAGDVLHAQFERLPFGEQINYLDEANLVAWVNRTLKSVEAYGGFHALASNSYFVGLINEVGKIDPNNKGWIDRYKAWMKKNGLPLKAMTKADSLQFGSYGLMAPEFIRLGQKQAFLMFMGLSDLYVERALPKMDVSRWMDDDTWMVAAFRTVVRDEYQPYLKNPEGSPYALIGDLRKAVRMYAAKAPADLKLNIFTW